MVAVGPMATCGPRPGALSLSVVSIPCQYLGEPVPVFTHDSEPVPEPHSSGIIDAGAGAALAPPLDTDRRRVDAVNSSLCVANVLVVVAVAVYECIYLCAL